MTTAARPWDALVPAEELEELRDAGFGELQGMGRSPCLLVIDVVTSFLGPRPGSNEPASAMSCGDMGWRVLPTIVGLVDTFRDSSLPIVFTKGDLQDKTFCGGSVKRTSTPAAARAAHDVGFPEELVPSDDEYVLSKPKASAFFGTPLVSYLLRNGIDSLVMVGTTTSGCVRATAVDASANNLKVVVVEDACFDRSPFAHAANLFDIHMKYGDVVTADAARAMLGATPASAGGS